MEGPAGEDLPLIGGARSGGGVPGRKFYVEVAGNTNDTHTEFVSRITNLGYVAAPSPAGSDFLLVFCPVVSRVGTDIGEALQNLDRNKAKVLVVMHHTFNPDQAIADSRRQVEDPNVLLTVDVLFHEHRLLSCDRNDRAWDQLCRVLVIPPPQASWLECITNCVQEKKKLVVCIGIGAGLVYIVTRPKVQNYILRFCSRR